MRKNSLYKHINICDADYLIPFGQAAANRKKAFRLNDSGVFIWDALDKANSFGALLEICKEEYEWNDEEASEYSSGIKSYVDVLLIKGIVEDTYDAGKIEDVINFLKEGSDKPSGSEAFCETKTLLNIAGIEAEINVPLDMLPDSFQKFNAGEASDEVLDHLSIDVRLESREGCANEKSVKIIETAGVRIYDCRDRFELFFLQNKYIKKVFVTKSAKEAVVYCKAFTKEEAMPEFPLEMSVAIRMCFLNLAQKHNMLAVHSASVLLNNKLVLFSAPSGTGKSTQARLWGEAFGARQINGDFNLLHVNNQKIEVHGTPWCGSSGICENITYELGFVAFLKQAPKNEIIEKNAHEKALSLLNRSFSPSWTEEMLLKNSEIVSNIAGKCDMCEFKCLPDVSAAVCLKERIS